MLNGRDTTERVRANEMLSQLAYTDAETGPAQPAATARPHDHAARVARRHSGSVTAIVIDLDDFRAVNESHGPRIGDSLLSEIARRLVEAAGPDAIVARLRSVEFAVAMPDVDDANVGERAAESLRVIVARAFIAEGHSARVTASIGIAVGSPGVAGRRAAPPRRPRRQRGQALRRQPRGRVGRGDGPAREPAAGRRAAPAPRALRGRPPRRLPAHRRHRERRAGRGRGAAAGARPRGRAAQPGRVRRSGRVVGSAGQPRRPDARDDLRAAVALGRPAAQPGARPRQRQRLAPPAARHGPGHPGGRRARGQRHRTVPAVARDHRERARRPGRAPRPSASPSCTTSASRSGSTSSAPATRR